MNDFVKELRSLADCDARAGEPLGKAMRKAADTIESLQAENARLREALEKVSNLMPDDYSPRVVEGMTGRIARSALTDPAAPSPDQK